MLLDFRLLAVNTPWLIGIPLWLLLGWGAFAYFEARAFRHPDQQNTLSRAIYNLGKTWPLSIFIFGFLIGAFVFGLGTHFYWNWDPTCAPPGVGG